MYQIKGHTYSNSHFRREISLEAAGGRTPRRRSFYNFFLRHQDAVDEVLASPSIIRKSVTPSGTMQSLNNMSAAVEDKPLIVQTTPKSKRATSFIRKKPPLERGLSAQSALRINKNALVGKKHICELIL